MRKHTPGPWSINHSNCDIEAEDGGISICYTFDSGTAIGNANARLIAAAPELLEVLQTIKRRMYEPRALMLQEVELMIDIAIAKATKC